MTAKTIMLQGASSSVGKSLLSAALCRIYARRGVRVAPFKAQNMSNNAAVCADGSEIGRAQALQAAAAGLPPLVDMNPVLIKPEADARSQIIVMGRPWQTLQARTYYENKAILWEIASAALDRLRAGYDLVIIEGAGSPVELNLTQGDIVNMAVARYARSPVLLVGDIDRGGIFSQLLGTLWLLEPDERALVRGFLVNKFRGDITLFDDGIEILEQKGQLPVLGVIPYLRGLALPDEDAVAVETAAATAMGAHAQVDIAVMGLPRIANFDDFDALRGEDGVSLRYVSAAADFGSPQAVILPGTKSTIADLDWLRQTGLAERVRRFAQDGGSVVGICGGYQMLGSTIHDPGRVESRQESVEGLGLLDAQTLFLVDKSTYQARAAVRMGRGWFNDVIGCPLEGYEIHMGETSVAGESLLIITQRGGQPVDVMDGAASASGRVWGCYLHGIFNNDAFRAAWLKDLGWTGAGTAQQQMFEDSLDALASSVEAALDMEKLEQIIWGN